MRRPWLLMGLVLLLAACGGTAAKGPDTYAQLHPTRAPTALDIWRDPRGRLIFHWDGDRPDEAARYDPATRTLFELSGGWAYSQTTYLSGRSAWRTIHDSYGVTASQVTAALAKGTPSAAPLSAQAKVPKHKNKGYYEVITDYGLNTARMARATGFTLPRMSSLGGYPLMDASMEPHGIAGVFFGPNPGGDSSITLNIAVVRPGHPDAPGTGYKHFYTKARRHFRAGGIRYAVTGGGAIFPYHGEWIFVSDGSVAPTWASVVRAVLAAPTN